MKKRDHNKIEKIVKEVIDHYEKGLIVSERNMQAEFYLHCRLAFGSLYKVFVEPEMKHDFEGESVKEIPDIVIVDDSENIKYIIELKYVPYGYPTYGEDFKKFMFLKDAKDIRLKTNPETGDYDDTKLYHVKVETVFVYFQICKSNSELHQYTEHEIKSNYKCDNDLLCFSYASGETEKVLNNKLKKYPHE